jgi:hypothetical protein
MIEPYRALAIIYEPLRSFAIHPMVANLRTPSRKGSVLELSGTRTTHTKRETEQNIGKGG